MKSTKERFIHTTCSLLEIQGYHGTGMNQIIEESGAPKGSLYYHFPDGKVQLAVEAVHLAGDNTADLIQENFPADIPLPKAVREFVLGIANQVEKSDYQSGSPLTAVAMETANTHQVLNQACREAFSRIETAFQDRLESAGVPSQQARQLSVFLTASIEGAILLSRTHHSPEPLQLVADQLQQCLQGLEI